MNAPFAKAAPTRIRDLDEAAFRARYGCGRLDATVLANRFEYVLEHVSQRLLACAFSPILRDFYDFAATMTGPGEIGYPTPVVSNSQLSFTGTMTESVRNTIEEYGPGRLQPGDVIIANDPYRTGTHVNDMLFCRPVFHDGRLCGFITIKAHQLDMGGSVPGGFSANKTSVYENGLVLSPRALIRAGEPVAETWSLIADNVRFAQMLWRDMQTIVACLGLGEELMAATLDRYGPGAVLGAMRYMCDADAERMATAIGQLPDGTWSGEALVDCDGIDDLEDYPVKVTIRKRGERIEVDLSGTARQARTSINGTYLDTKTSVGVALKYMLDPGGPFTSGLYRPVDIVIPDGAICSALPPDGVVFAYGESTNALILAMMQAMAQALGPAAIGGDLGSPNFHTGYGRHPDGTPWVSPGVAGGGQGAWGATRAGDANSYAHFYQVNGLDNAIEAAEADTPMAVLRREYAPDTAGAGFNRGGASVVKDSLWLEPADHSLIALRFKRPTGLGVHGGRAGGPAGIWRWGPTDGPFAQRSLGADAYGDAEPVAGCFDPQTRAARADGEFLWFGRDRLWSTQPGAVFRYLLNGGGGWGDPFTRDPERVRRDVRDGYVSQGGAARDYGVVISGDPEWDPEGLQIDEAATRALRHSLASKA